MLASRSISRPSISAPAHSSGAARSASKLSSASTTLGIPARASAIAAAGVRAAAMRAACPSRRSSAWRLAASASAPPKSLKARARIENQAVRRRHADAGGVSVCGLRQEAQTPAFFGDIAVEVLEVGDDAAGGGERRTGRDAGGARRDVHERHPLAVHEHRSSAALVRPRRISAFEDLKAEMRQVDAVPERGPPLSLRGRRRRERRCYSFASFALFTSFAPFAR